LRIVFVSHSAELYGAELCLHELLKSVVAAEGHAVEVVCPEDGALIPMLAELGVDVTVIPYGRWATRPASPRRKLRLLRRNLYGVLQLYRHLRARRPQLVVTSTVTVPSAALAARMARIPHVLYAQEYGVEAHGVSFHFGRRRSLRLLGRLSSRVLAASHALERELASVIEPAKLRVVYYAADMEIPPEHRPAEDQPLRVVMLGYKSPAKGQDQAIRAVAMLRDRGVEVSLVLAGGGSPRYVESLSSLSRELGVEDRVEHVGFVEGSPFECFAAGDAALSCSELEGLPRVVVEAMKCGCPVVGARSGGTEELITDGWNGYLYEPGDVADLAAKIELLDADRNHARALGRNAAVWARARFTQERYAHDFLAVAASAVAASDRLERA
jgi:glycosyltransferase involved in cell wall biosynthesis